MKYDIRVNLHKIKKEEDIPQYFINDHSEIEAFLLQNLTCPYPKIKKERLDLICTFLYDLWLTTCMKFSIDSEYNFIYFHKSEADLLLMDNDLDLELYPVIINTSRWIELAERTFEDLCRPYNCKLATKKKYSKHYSSINYSKEELKEITKNGKPSKFFYRPDNNLFEKILDYCLLHFYFDLQHAKNLKVAIECDMNIGVDDGEITKYILMEIDIGSRIAHCRPIKESTYHSDRFDLVPIIPSVCYDEYLLNIIYNNRNGLRIKYDNSINFSDNINLEDRLERK
jgi:hypothetical protein